MTLKQRIERIQMLLTQGNKFYTQACKELKELKNATTETCQKIHESYLPELPFMEEHNNDCDKTQEHFGKEYLKPEEEYNETKTM